MQLVGFCPTPHCRGCASSKIRFSQNSTFAMATLWGTLGCLNVLYHHLKHAVACLTTRDLFRLFNTKFNPLGSCPLVIVLVA